MSIVIILRQKLQTAMLSTQRKKKNLQSSRSKLMKVKPKTKIG